VQGFDARSWHLSLSLPVWQKTITEGKTTLGRFAPNGGLSWMRAYSTCRLIHFSSHGTSMSFSHDFDRDLSTTIAAVPSGMPPVRMGPEVDLAL
jgi:hypothetical protein